MAEPLRDPVEPFKRLFFALPCAPAQRREIARWRSQLRLIRGKPVPAAHFHVTLLFLGDVGVTMLPRLCAAVDALTKPDRPPLLHLDRLDTWRKSQVLVLGASQPEPAIQRLAYDLQQAMQGLGIESDHRDWRPHLTLVRQFPEREPEASQAPDFLLKADRFVLYESYKGEYVEVAEWSLRQTPAPVPPTAGKPGVPAFW